MDGNVHGNQVDEDYVGGAEYIEEYVDDEGDDGYVPPDEPSDDDDYRP